MKLNSLENVFEEALKDLYSAESQIARALPKMAKGASAPELKKAFEQHLEVTKKQIERLEQVCKDAGIKPTGKKCEGMEGLLKESEEVLKEKGNGAARDAALIMAAQKVEHYEIAGYGSVRTFAEHLGLKRAARLLQQTLNEESKTDEKLTAIAERSVNFEAEEEDAAPKGRSSKSAASRQPAGKATRSASAGKSSSAKSSSAKSSSAKSSSSAARSSQGSTRSTTAQSGRSAGSRTSTSGAAKGKKSASSSRSAAGSGKSAKKGSNAGATTDHEFIRQWVEERGGTPACVRGTGDPGDIGLLRIDFPGYSGEQSLQPISWDEFFEKFEEKKLAFLHQDRTAGGETSRFFKLVSRDNADS